MKIDRIDALTGYPGHKVTLSGKECYAADATIISAQLDTLTKAGSLTILSDASQDVFRRMCDFYLNHLQIQYNSCVREENSQIIDLKDKIDDLTSQIEGMKRRHAKKDKPEAGTPEISE